MKIIPVILAGGAGTRLWPLSREDKPKQFHNLSGEGTLLEETIKRLIPLNPETYIIVTSGKYEKDSLEELGKCGVKGKVLAEPFPRNTAAAVLYAATYLVNSGEDSIMIMLPADHYIKRKDEFQRIISLAIEEAQQDKLVSIGIKPTYPETGYGYIKAFEGNGEVLQVEMFVEKPNIETARRYIMEGNYFWNSGIFIWKASVIMEAFKKLMFQHYKAFDTLRGMSTKDLEANSPQVMSVKEKAFQNLESTSIDYGIMEKAEDRVVIPGDFGWADLGSWNSIDDILHPDGNMNRTPEHDHVIFLNSRNCSVFPETKRISIIGLSNVVVVESGDDILVMDKNASQEVRKVVEMVKGKKTPTRE